MYMINEKQNRFGTYFEVKNFDSKNRLTGTEYIQYVCYTAEIQNRKIYLIYDNDMNLMEDAVRFINFGGMHRQSLNYILTAINSIKFLYAYLQIFNISLKTMTNVQAVSYIDFLRGISRDGETYCISLTTNRESETVNSHLNIARKFVSFLGYDNHILLGKNDTKTTAAVNETVGIKFTNPYKITAKHTKKDLYVPAYINIEEFKQILKETEKYETSLRDKVICRLMFEHGLRLGEVLGLTLEDIKYKESDGLQIQYRLELRNRYSDRYFQNAKSVMKISQPEDYKLPEYIRKNVGYQTIIISENLAQDLMEYINTAHNSRNKDFMARRKKYAAADSVPYGNPDIRTNYYVFLNTIGKPLSADCWNKHIREVFVDAGLTIDKGKRKNNLNHRFRHGYAMYLSEVLKVKDFDVKTLMRHKTLQSTIVYHNLSPEDIEALQDKLLLQWDNSLLEE